MRIRTEKTETEATLPVSDEALEYCGQPSTDKVFKGLERSMTQHPLQKRIRAAGIERNITFHCFRHTFATLQIALGTDIFTVSKMSRTKTSRPSRFMQSWSMRRSASRPIRFH